MVIHYLNNKILSEVIQAEIMEAGIAEKNIHVHVFALVIDNFNIYLNDQESFIV